MDHLNCLPITALRTCDGWAGHSRTYRGPQKEGSLALVQSVMFVFYPGTCSHWLFRLICQQVASES